MDFNRTFLSAAALAALTVIGTQANAQTYFSENFDTADTAGIVAKGWDLGKNEFAKEVGTEFVVAPDWAKGPEEDPGTAIQIDGVNIYNPPTTDGTASEGGFLISDSDSADGSDDVGSKSEFWAITPSFSTTGASEVWFHADVEIDNNNNGECVVEFAASVDDGATWIPFWVTVEPARPFEAVAKSADGTTRINGWPEFGTANYTKSWGGVHGRMHVQLPAEAANKANVKIRFEYYEPGDAWWIAIDNIVVDNQPAPMGSQVILEEKFDNGIPSTWSNNPITGKTQTWDTRPIWNTELDEPAKESNSFIPIHIDFLEHLERNEVELDLTVQDAEFNSKGITDGRWILMLAGRNYALWQESPDLESGSTLDTPSLNLGNASEVYLDFLSEMLQGDGSVFYEVYVSVDGGTSWQRIFTYREALTDFAEAAYFDHHYIPIPAAAGKSDVKIRFSAKGGDAAYEGFWAIDDVRVTANTGATDVIGWDLY